MCGIIGYAGAQPACEVLLKTMAGLEYRGYDSSGVSIFEAEGIVTAKARGRLTDLTAYIEQKKLRFDGHCGIGHTRWATHGEPSDLNAHPHGTGKLSLVHNGIIENYQPLRTTLKNKGYRFITRTDTEVASCLLDLMYEGDPVEAIRRAQQQLEGSFAFAILFADRPGEVYATRRGNPLILARSQEAYFFASDIPAILPYTRDIAPLEEHEIACITADQVTIYQPDGKQRIPMFQTATWTVEQAQKGGYPHFMLKEIQEQPQALRNTVGPRVFGGLPSFEPDDIPDGFWKQFDRVCIAACGTAWHAGLLGRDLIESLARIPVTCEVASEFRYRNPILNKRTLVLLISQSGETTDTLAALRLARQSGATTLAVANVSGSSITQEADYVIHTYAGPEISVASTKAFTVQLATMYLIAFKLALAAGTHTSEQVLLLTNGLLRAIDTIPEVLRLESSLKLCATQLQSASSVFFIGRGLDLPSAMEGALKLSEIGYIHCAAYPAGELQHGAITLLTSEVAVVAVATQSALLSTMMSNMKEARARGAKVLLICRADQVPDRDLCDEWIRLPEADDVFLPMLTVVALQQLAYYTAVLRGCDIDQPRNPTKSVTLE